MKGNVDLNGLLASRFPHFSARVVRCFSQMCSACVRVLNFQLSCYVIHPRISTGFSQLAVRVAELPTIVSLHHVDYAFSEHSSSRGYCCSCNVAGVHLTATHASRTFLACAQNGYAVQLKVTICEDSAHQSRALTSFISPSYVK